jgi:O-antigen/teichoic acid export membrane protein
VVLTPLYIRFLGIEAWGVVGVFVSLQAIFALLDMGLSVALNREMARLSVQQGKAQEMRNLVRTLELIYWAVALAIGILVFLLAPLIAGYWLQASQLSPETIHYAIRVMGLAICLQWPFGLYSGGLLGLQRQVVFGGINSGIATLRGAGAVVILWKISPTLQAFFFWQAVIGILQTGLAGAILWRSLPIAEAGAVFQRKLLRDTWRFAAGMTGITVMSLILTQMDKIILSRLLKLDMFGYYVFAGAAATGIYLLILPVFYALYPRFTQLVSLGDEEGLKRLYHDSCQFISVLILPVSVVIALFSKEILFLWTGNPTTVEHTHSVLSILVIGNALNGLMHLPHALQLAYGWTKLILNIYVFSVLTLAPLIILMASLYGAVGAASVWVVFNGGLTLVGVQLMHRRLLKGEQWRWYLEDVGLPLVVSLGAALLCSALVPTGLPRFQLPLVLAVVTLFVTGSTVIATPVTRLALVDHLRFWRGRVFNTP